MREIAQMTIHAGIALTAFAVIAVVLMLVLPTGAPDEPDPNQRRET